VTERGACTRDCRPGRVTVAALTALLALPAAALQVLETGQGPFPLAAGAGARELSGIAWAGGERFLAVSDKDAALYRLIVRLDPVSGRIDRAEVTGRQPIREGVDLEGVAHAPDGTAYVSDEVGPAVRRYEAATGRERGSVRLPPVFATARKNQSLESLALSADGRTLWTANEEALKGDGPTNLESGGEGTTVRLQRFRADRPGAWRPDGQWAYHVDGVEPFLGRAPSGLVDLAVLPDGTLLALERAAGIVGLAGDLPTAQVRFRSRLYAVDLRGAPDTSRLARLGSAVQPVRKELLWEATFPSLNVEGIAVGPVLRGGERTLLLMSDDGNGLGQALYALRLRLGASAGGGRR
jgi:hypothetical protein